MKFSCWIFILVEVLFSCQNESKRFSKAEYAKYASKESSGLTKIHEIRGIQVKVTYQPNALLISKELEIGQSQDSDLIRKLEDQYKDRYYFIVTFSREGKELLKQMGDKSKYSDMVQVFSFQMGSYVNLITADLDTVELSDFYFDQTYGIGDGNNILLSFDKAEMRNSETFDINIAECGLGIGDLKFRFRREDLDDIPSINYSAF